jgi:hypothetical protein
MKKLLLLSALLIFACSSDDSNDNNDDSNQTSIISKWYSVKIEHYEDGVLMEVDNVKEYEVNGCRSYLDIKSDYTFEYFTPFVNCDGVDGQVFGTWELINNDTTLKVYFDSEGELVSPELDIITLNNNNLVTEGEEYCDGGNICEFEIEYFER